MKEPLKRYLLFSYPEYYPAGGWGDFDDSFHTLLEAQEAAKEQRKARLYCDIVDITTGEEL